MAYDKNDTVRFILRITDPTDADTPVDPSGLTFKTKNPSAATSTYTYGTDAALVKDSTGNYHIDLQLATAGTWHYRWDATGSFAGAQEGSIVVNTSQF